MEVCEGCTAQVVKARLGYKWQVDGMNYTWAGCAWRCLSVQTVCGADALGSAIVCLWHTCVHMKLLSIQGVSSVVGVRKGPCLEQRTVTVP